MGLWRLVSSLCCVVLRLTQEKEALFTPVALMLVTTATVGFTRFAFRFFAVGLLGTGLVTVVFKPKGGVGDGVSSVSYVDIFFFTTII